MRHDAAQRSPRDPDLRLSSTHVGSDFSSPLDSVQNAEGIMIGWAGAARTQIGTTPIADAVPMRGDGTGGCGRCALARVSNLVSLAP